MKNVAIKINGKISYIFARRKKLCDRCSDVSLLATCVFKSGVQLNAFARYTCAQIPFLWEIYKLIGYAIKSHAIANQLVIFL